MQSQPTRYYPQPQTLAATPFDAMIVIVAAEGATAAIAGLDSSGACLVSLYNRTANSFTTLLSQNTTGICVQIITYSKAKAAIVYSGIYTSPAGAKSLTVGSVAISGASAESQEVGAYSAISALTAIA